MNEVKKVLFTTQEVAKRYGFSKHWVIRKRGLGEGPKFIKLGKDPHAPIRYRLEDLEAYFGQFKPQNKTSIGPTAPIEKYWNSKIKKN